MFEQSSKFVVGFFCSLHLSFIPGTKRRHKGLQKERCCEGNSIKKRKMKRLGKLNLLTRMRHGFWDYKSCKQGRMDHARETEAGDNVK